MRTTTESMTMPTIYESDNTRIVSEAIASKRIIPLAVQGDGMLPEYLNGDVVFIDTDYKNPAGGGVFAFKMYGAPFVCRCDVAPNGIAFIWKNSHFQDQVYSIDVFDKHVIGRVVGHIQPSMVPECIR